MRSRRNTFTFHQKKKRITSKLIREIFSWLFITILATVIAFALVFAFGMQVKVIGDSMEPALYNSQAVLVDRALSKIISPKTGDIIVFLPNGNVNSHYYVKRVVATPGEKVQIIDGNLYVNDEIRMEDSDIYDKMEDEGIAANPIKLQSGEYFVLGDNRNSSEDSRSANIGIVKSGMIVGKAWFKLKSENAQGGPILNHY
ncbi:MULTISPECIES: signal peptidase I [unclassified Butyrivibrio]|uniref:signal peptidase I n=1 Tax=unclassified Butyrivibrio TaxID=2639466 RepID=UPI0003B71B1F|nr:MULTISPECIES: signal peptidase I [unclassified Butyrivibrio]